MAREHLVIVGNGPAADEAAPFLRKGVPDARITIIGREVVSYYRPDLLPDFVAGKIAEEDLWVNPLQFYKERDIKLRLGQNVVSVDFSKMELALEHKEVVRFDGMIIATGGKHRIPEPLARFRELVLTLKTVADAKVWIEKLTRVESVLVIGCDLTSVVFTKAILSLGKQVTFFFDPSSPHLFGRSESIREQLAHKMSDLGAEVVDCSKIAKLVQTREDLIEVTTEAGQFRAGAVGAFFGMVPDVKFLTGSGLHIERGILVDEYLQTNFKRIYAAGDCAQVYHPELCDYWVSIGYSNARELGRIAALNLAGEEVQTEAPLSSIFKIDGRPINTSWWMEA